MVNRKIPKIRFKHFGDGWKSDKLGNLGTVAMNKRIFKEETSEVGEVPFYKIGTFGGEPDSFITRNKFEEYKSKFPYPEIGDILISASGSIGRTVEYQGEEAYFQDSNIVWLKHDERLDNSFLKQFYSIVKWQGVEGTTIKRLYNKNILETPITLPSISEQSAIGSLFCTLDDLLSSYKDNLANYQTLKTTMLSKMFPKAGQTIPEIRLDGFEGEWEIKRADEIFKSVSEKNKASLPVLSASQIDGMVLRDEIGIDIKYDEAALNNYKVVKPGQFVIHLRSFQGGFALSKLEGITSPAYTIIDFIDKKNNIPDFWNSILTSRDFIKRLETVTYGIRDGKSISFKDFSSLKFAYPELEEQQAIGVYFSNLDQLIISYQDKITHLDTLKKKLLQDMFI
mgnify:CR=1 FL=1